MQDMGLQAAGGSVGGMEMCQSWTMIIPSSTRQGNRRGGQQKTEGGTKNSATLGGAKYGVGGGQE